MSWQLAPYIWPLATAATAPALFSAILWRRRKVPGAGMLALIVISSFLWCFGYVLELASSELPMILFWAKVQYTGIVTVPVWWYLFARRYTGSLLSLRVALALLVLPLTTFVFILTNDAHHLFWSQVGETGTSPNRLVVSYGTWFWIHTVYAYGLIMTGTVVLLHVSWRSPGRFRGQVGVLMLSATLPLIANFLYLSGLSSLDLTPFGFALAAGIIVWAIYRLQLLDLVPIARSAVVESLSDGVIVVDNEGRIVDVNPAALVLLQRAGESLVGRKVDEVFSQQASLIERYRGVGGVRQEILVLGERYFELNLSPLLQKGRPQGQISLLRDVTTRVKAEAALKRAKEEAESVSEAKSDFLANMSHELRTPLTAIIGFSDLLAEELFGPLNDKQKQYIGDILKASTHLFSLVEDILDFAASEDEEPGLSPLAFEFKPLLDEIVSRLNEQIVAKKNSLRLEVSPDIGVMYTDPDMLRQILLHLLENAVKFTESGTITLRARLAQVDETEQLVIDISDTGIGIAADSLATIFEAFTQVDTSATRSYGGSGLGLALSKRYCDLMGGDISVQSSPGEGSTFTIRLPLYAPALQGRRDEADNGLNPRDFGV